MHNFKLINSNHHVQTLENGSLSIRQISKEHEGLYLCEADNGVEPNLVKTIRLVVHQQAQFYDDIQVLVVVQDNSSYAHLNGNVPLGSILGLGQVVTQQATGAQLGATSLSNVKSFRVPQNTSLVRLICAPFGDPPLQLDWLKDGRLVHTHSTAAAGPLAPLEHEPSHGQTHHRPIDQPGGSSSGGLPAAPGQAVEYHQAGGGPIGSSSSARYHVSTRWARAGDTSPTRPAAALESELLLANLARPDAGLYTCAARNAFGQSEKKLRLVVQEPPEAPALVDVAHISSRSIGLRWLAPFDGNAPISKYIIEYRKQPSGEFRHALHQPCRLAPSCAGVARAP